MAPVEAIQLENVHVTYRTNEMVGYGLRKVLRTKMTGRTQGAVDAVRGVDLTVSVGEVLGIVGRNGSGKSTLVRAMAGLIPPTDGRVLARSQPVLLGVGSTLKSGLSGRQNVRIGLLALGFRGSRLDGLEADTIGFAGLGSAIERPLGSYSSGMRARLSFAVATAVEPSILLVDEALSVGDKDFKTKSYSRIEELKSNAGTVVFVSHSLAEIERICDRVIWLHDGQVVADGPTKTVVSEYRES